MQPSREQMRSFLIAAAAARLDDLTKVIFTPPIAPVIWRSLKGFDATKGHDVIREISGDLHKQQQGQCLLEASVGDALTGQQDGPF